MRVVATGSCISALLALCGCGGPSSAHWPPCGGPTTRTYDELRLNIWEPGSLGLWTLMYRDVVCHYRPDESSIFLDRFMQRVGAPEKGATFAVEVPGVSAGRTEYYFTWVDLKDNVHRVPREGNFRCSQ